MLGNLCLSNSFLRWIQKCLAKLTASSSTKQLESSSPRQILGRGTNLTARTLLWIPKTRKAPKPRMWRSRLPQMVSQPCMGLPSIVFMKRGSVPPSSEILCWNPSTIKMATATKETSKRCSRGLALLRKILLPQIKSPSKQSLVKKMFNKINVWALISLLQAPYSATQTKRTLD